MSLLNNSLAVGCVSGTVRIYDLEAQTRIEMNADAKNINKRNAADRVVGVARHGEQDLVVATEGGNVYEVDLRTGGKSLEYERGKLGQEVAQVIGLEVRERNVYVSHQDYISKWYAGIAGFAGIIETGFECSAIKAT